MKTGFLFIIILFFLSASFLQACKTVSCLGAEIEIGFISFSSSEIDTIVIKQYEKNSGFSHFYGSFEITGQYKNSGDSLDFSNGIRLPLYSNFDYEIFIPATGKTYQVTDIMEEKKDFKTFFLNSVKVACLNNLISLEIDGQPVIPDRTNHFYLQK